MSGSRRTRPSRRLSNSRSAPPSSKRSVNRSHSGLERACAAAGCRRSRRPRRPRRRGSVTRIRPLMPRWMPSTGRRRTSRTHIDLPRRWAATQPSAQQGGADLAGRVRPADPGVGVVDVDDRAGRARTARSTARADSTSGSSGTRSVLPVAAPRRTSPGRRSSPGTRPAAGGRRRGRTAGRSRRRRPWRRRPRPSPSPAGARSASTSSGSRAVDQPREVRRPGAADAPARARDPARSAGRRGCGRQDPATG